MGQYWKFTADKKNFKRNHPEKRQNPDGKREKANASKTEVQCLQVQQFGNK